MQPRSASGAGGEPVAPPRIVVLGAGVSGLAAAFTAAREGAGALPGLQVVVLEPRSVVGGRAASWAADGWLVEGGPSGYLDGDVEVARLVQAAGLGDRVVRASADAARRYILLGGRLREVGPSPWRMLRSGLLGPAAMLRVLGEALVRPHTNGTEESVRDFAARRFGAAVADRIVRTAALGIFAGDAERLSLDACFPEVRALERAHGSILRGLLARRRRASAPEPGGPTRRLTSFVGGLQELPRALGRHPGVEVRHGVEAVAIARPAPAAQPRRRFLVATRDGPAIEADAVIVATPAGPAARLLGGLAPATADALRAIPVPPVTVVALGYQERATRALPRGFGTLVARGEGLRMLGSLWESQIYPGRAPAGHTLVRVMYGGRLDPEVAACDDDALTDLAIREMREAFAVSGAPVLSMTFRWPAAIPQYELGHVRLRRRIHAELATVPGLLLAGDALDGVSFVKTAASGVVCGRQAVAELVRGNRHDGPEIARGALA